MPETIALGIAFLLSNGAAILGASVATQAILAGAAVSAIAVGAIGVGLSAGISLAGNALLGSQLTKDNAAPIPSVADGKVNQKQGVPSRSYVYGTVRKAGDIMFLEERDGTAYMLIAHASHKIDSFEKHYLSDAAVEVDDNGNVTKSLSEDEDAHKYYRLNGKSKVRILERVGALVGLPYEQLVDKFSQIWSEDHRGDSIASVLFICKSVRAQDHTTVYPYGFPSISSQVRGKHVFDPRDESYKYSENLCLIRLDLLLAPYGGALSLDQINLTSWAQGADVCDRQIENFSGDFEPAYHGGLHGRENNDPTHIGRILDEAGEMVLYTDADGKIAVHAGTWAEPDIHLKTKSIQSMDFLANRSPASNIETVRGLWTNPELDYSEDTAVIYGEPYVEDSDPRSITVDNSAVQRHNHMRRMQKIAYIRAKAPRVRVVCDYFASEQLPFRRFVKITDPPHLVEAYLELIGTPTFNLETFTHHFEGIVVPRSLYDFEPEEEGEKGAPPVKIGSQAIPGVDEFAIEMQQQGGSIVAIASFTRLSDALFYELEYIKTSGGTAKYAQANSDASNIKTEALTQNIEYRFRMRARSILGQNSDWSDPEVATATV
ncbi:hypothetical protein [Pseudovibrio sp. Tun.PSC04-5.I4]|uniref:hypothetical protein n=1 Tax=Pseudovibrio sp. Tun.PSC04-5.I4 TaxID=1798213 RepID=UPI00087E9C26|nr:hypothetical protein [Pseudovibrio sp. Tun.PSC04-5.I4]SDR19796.1 hypothetical protein SAMN04515695_3342 [Pseudovibrio sp. Tun.PSC04-5.I4]